MAWAIVVIVLLIAVGVGWYVLQSTPTVGPSDGGTSSDPAGTIQDTEGHKYVGVGVPLKPGQHLPTEDEAKAARDALPADITQRGGVIVAVR